MTQSNPFETLHQERARKAEQARHLAQVAHQWDSAIREGLRQLAEALWPAEHLLELIHLRRYRLRHQVGPSGHLWWVEHDLLPSGRYLCAAYRVRLSVNDGGKPLLSVQSGPAVYPVTPLTVDALGAVLGRAGEDPPLVIPREMGAAEDP